MKQELQGAPERLSENSTSLASCAVTPTYAGMSSSHFINAASLTDSPLLFEANATRPSNNRMSLMYFPGTLEVCGVSENNRECAFSLVPSQFMASKINRFQV